MSIIRQLPHADAVDWLSITLAPDIVVGGACLINDLGPSSWRTTDARLTESGALRVYLDRSR